MHNAYCTITIVSPITKLLIHFKFNLGCTLKLFYFKGFAQGEGTNIKLISKIIEEKLKIPCSVLMGANLANEVAEEHFCETTIGLYFL